MTSLETLFENNKKWAKELAEESPDRLKQLAIEQKPKFLWIGCSDSRVPASKVVGLPPGEMFVHRNIANLVPSDDLSSLSVIQFAVEVLKVEHIIVCGHYGCGGVIAALSQQDMGVMNHWIDNIKNVYKQNETVFRKVGGEETRENLLCELNVKEQVKNVCRTDAVQKAWETGEKLSVHGWVYSLESGLVKDLEVEPNA